MGKTDKRAGITTGLKRKNGMLAGLLIMALLCCGCGAGTTQTALPGTSPVGAAGTAVPGTASSAPSEEDKKDMVYLRIQALPEMSAEGLAAARPVLITRLDLYAGNGPWILECFEDPEGERPCGPEDDFVRADVWYPAELFEDKDILSQARAMIIRPMKLFLVQYSNGSMRGGFLELPREAIASLEGGSGNCDALDAADYEMKEDEFFWVRMRLRESFAEEHREEFESVKGQLAVIQDADMQNMYFGFRMVPGDTPEDWYIVLDSTTEKRFRDLVLYNYSQPPLETGFLLYDRREPVTWTEPAKAQASGTTETAAAGAPESCLVSRSDLTGDRLRLTFQPGDREYGEKEWQAVLAAMQTRMDLIGKPYCMGISDLCDRRIVIETENVTRMGYPVMQLLADGQSLHLACTTMSLVDLKQPGKDRIEVLTEGDRILGLAVDVSERHTIGLYKEMQDGLRLGAEEIVLLDDAYHYFRAPMDAPDGDGKLLMTSKISGIGEREAEDGWFYRLARQVILDEITDDFDQTAGYYSAEGEPLEMPEFPVRK